ISGYDAFFFYTTGDPTQEGGDKQPPMTKDGKKALLEAVAGGEGFIGAHRAPDTFPSPNTPDHAFQNPEVGKTDPHIRMLGGEFSRHGEQQEAELRAVSPEFPGAKGLGSSLRLKEEWYSLKNFSSDIHVVVVQDTKGMRNLDYERPPFPETWARKHQK